MDARELLTQVAEAYANLKTLSVDIAIARESHDADSSDNNLHRARGFFVAPGNVRVEMGRQGLTVTNGVDVVHRLGRTLRYTRNALRPGVLPGLFRPQSPLVDGNVFLFGPIGEHVVDAGILRTEPASGERADQCYVLSVQYQPSPHPFVKGSSVLFWVNARTHLVSKLVAETTHHMPPDHGSRAVKLTLEFARAISNELIPPETFEFTPPEGAIEHSPPLAPSGAGGPGRVLGGVIASGGVPGGGGGFGFGAPGWQFRPDVVGPGPGGRRRTHAWDGGTMIQYSRTRLHGIDLEFERRLTVSDDRKELRIVERITGPKGDTEHEITVPLA